MSVIDFLKEKSDRLAKSRLELLDILNPSMRGYVTEAMNSARNSHWFGWALDQKELDEKSLLEAWPHATNPHAQKMLNELNSKMHEVVFEGQWLRVDQQRINQFADVTDDHQWIHTDPERAKVESPFRTTIAHGFLTLSLIPKLIDAVNTDTPLYPATKMVVNMGFNKVRFPYPVKVGANIRATKKIVDVKTTRRGIELTEEITIEVEGLRRPACVAESLMLLVY